MTPEQAFTNLYNIVGSLSLPAAAHFQLKAAFEEAGKVIFKKTDTPTELPAEE